MTLRFELCAWLLPGWQFDIAIATVCRMAARLPAITKGPFALASCFKISGCRLSSHERITIRTFHTDRMPHAESLRDSPLVEDRDCRGWASRCYRPGGKIRVVDATGRVQQAAARRDHPAAFSGLPSGRCRWRCPGCASGVHESGQYPQVFRPEWHHPVRIHLWGLGDHYR